MAPQAIIKHRPRHHIYCLATHQLKFLNKTLLLTISLFLPTFSYFESRVGRRLTIVEENSSGFDLSSSRSSYVGKGTPWGQAGKCLHPQVARKRKPALKKTLSCWKRHLEALIWTYFRSKWLSGTNDIRGDSLVFVVPGHPQQQIAGGLGVIDMKLLAVYTGPIERSRLIKPRINHELPLKLGTSTICFTILSRDIRTAWV